LDQGAGTRAAYFPFGEELTPIAQDAEQMKFTGHERDLGVAGNAADDLDYMHARLHNPQTGRFLSVDPVLNVKRAMKRPQAWNRYAYVTGNPMKYVDPSGLDFVLSGCVGKTTDKGLCDKQKSLLQQAFGDSYRFLSVGADGRIAIKSAFFASRGTFEAGFAKLVGSKDTFTLFTQPVGGGGGRTEALAGGGANIYIDSERSRFTMGDIANGTAGEVFVHETGHAVGFLHSQYRDEVDATLSNSYLTKAQREGYAVSFENRYRSERKLEQGVRMYFEVPGDVFYDGEIPLFPPN
jgi:RHS repeat-associated protein